MNPVSFSDCIRNNGETLGQDCENLGGYIGTGFLGTHKVYFSYDAASGWSIVRLNVFQFLLRNVLGFYKSTRTDTIVKQLKILKSHDWEALKIPKIQDFWENWEALNMPRIQDFWEKRYFIKFGNSEGNGEFQVRCYGECHGKKFYRKQVCEDISKNYRPGDIILVEGVEAGKKITKTGVQTTQYLAGNEYDIEGWEPENYHELNSQFECRSKFVDEFRRNREDLIKLTQDIKKSIDAYWASKNLDEFIKNTSGFVSKYNELRTYFSPENKPLPEDFITRLLRITSKVENPMLAMKIVIGNFAEELMKNAEKQLHKRVATTEVIKIIMAQSLLRNKSLHDQIEKYAMDGRRVFVLGGVAHFLFCEKHITASKDALKPVHDALSKHKFEIFCKRTLAHELGASSLGFRELS